MSQQETIISLPTPHQEVIASSLNQERIIIGMNIEGKPPLPPRPTRQSSTLPSSAYPTSGLASLARRPKEHSSTLPSSRYPPTNTSNSSTECQQSGRTLPFPMCQVPLTPSTSPQRQRERSALPVSLSQADTTSSRAPRLKPQDSALLLSLRPAHRTCSPPPPLKNKDFSLTSSSCQSMGSSSCFFTFEQEDSYSSSSANDTLRFSAGITQSSCTSCAESSTSVATLLAEPTVTQMIKESLSTRDWGEPFLIFDWKLSTDELGIGTKTAERVRKIMIKWQSQSIDGNVSLLFSVRCIIAHISIATQYLELAEMSWMTDSPCTDIVWDLLSPDPMNFAPYSVITEFCQYFLLLFHKAILKLKLPYQVPVHIRCHLDPVYRNVRRAIDERMMT